MKDSVDLNEHLYHCYVASLYNNIIPPQPHDYLVKPSSNGLTVSIGSLIFFKVLKTDGIKRCNSVDSFFATLPQAKTTSYGKAKCQAISKRSTPVLVKCTMYSKYRQISDTVVIRLNRAGIPGLREAQVETQSANVQPVKHRTTYCTRSKKNSRVKVTSAFSLLNRSSSLKAKIDSLEFQSCSFPSMFICRLYRTRIHSFLKRLVKRFPKHQQRRNQVFDESNATFVSSSMNRCRDCKRWAPRKRLHLNMPLIIPVGCIINFEPRKSLESFRDGLKLYCELYIDDVEIAASTICLKGANAGAKASMVSFYANAAFEHSIHPQVPRQCCCKLKDMLLCSLHLTWMLNQVSDLYGFICNAKGNIVVHRFLLYFFLQMSAFMQNRTLKMCTSHAVPVAIMSITAHMCQEQSAEVATCALDDNCRLVLSNIFNQGSTKVFDDIYEKTKNIKLKNIKALLVSLSDLDVDSSTSLSVDELVARRTIAFPLRLNPNDTLSVTTCPLCKRSVEIMSQFADLFTINSNTLVYLPEPYDLLVLKRLMQRPMYDVHMKPIKEQSKACDTDCNVADGRNGDVDGGSGSTSSGTEGLSFGSMKHKEINALIWKYYGVICKSGRCLATFLRFVDWSDTKEVFDALLLLRLWARPSTESLVELVSVDFAPPNVPKCVRRILVELLKNRLTPAQVTHYMFQFIYSSTKRGHYANDPLYIWIMDSGTKHYETGVHLYWILKSACMNAKSGQVFLKVLKDFVIRLKTSNEAITEQIMQTIKLQHSFKSEMVELKQLISVQWSGNASERTSLLVNHLLSNTHQWAKLEPYVCKDKDKSMDYLVRFGHDIPLLTDTSVCIRGIYPRRCSVVRSNNTPLLLNLLTDAREQSILLMFKTGEDIRQDQLCQQLVRAFNYILAKHRVDSYLVGYGVLPTGIKDGCVQFLSDAQSISAILRQYNGLEAYLAAHCKGTPELQHCKTNFVYSLASYSVFTYVLGVGDRHHDNMLITKQGHVVHVDYTFVFGADPKPLPVPPFRLSKEMVDLMGGTRSKWYKKFKNRFFRIFFIIRLHAPFIIQLLYHSLNAHLQHLTLETIMKVEARFALGINNFQQLEQHVNKLVDSSCNALVPAVLERWHEWVITWK